MNYEQFGPKVKTWTKGVLFEEAAQGQVANTASLPIVVGMAVMPDVHYGMGSTVGSVIATRKAIIPSSVGVDIGCVDSDTEFLSPTGWTRFGDVDDKNLPEVLVYYPSERGGMARFEYPQNFVRRPSEGFYHLRTKYGIDQKLSADHKMLVYHAGRSRSYTKFSNISAGEFVSHHREAVLGHGDRIRTSPERVELPFGDVGGNNEAAIRVAVMVAADGFQSSPGMIRLKLRKERKITRARELLTSLGTDFDERVENGSGDTIFDFRGVKTPLTFDNFGDMSAQGFQTIFDEILHWDGHSPDRVFFTRKREEADFVQWVFIVNGKRAVMRADRHVRDGELDYRVFWHNNVTVGVKATPKNEITFDESPDGLEYCFTVNSGYFLIRRNGVTALTGNCGMVALRTSLTANDLPDSLSHLRSEIERAVPVGRTNNGGAGDQGSWNGRSGVPASVSTAFRDNLQARFDVILDKYPKIGPHNALTHLGSLGGGNHFIEVCLDEDDRVWVMLHSGSRGVGNRIGQLFINKAKEDMARRHQGVPDADLSYLEAGTDLFDDYLEAMHWAQDFAALSRKLMLDRVIAVLRANLPPFTTEKVAINCHHNYATTEVHGGEELIITRKGAVNAEKGKLGIIPGSMGTGSFIVRGLGNSDAFNSCSHGAGRVMSRTKAKKLISVEQHAEATKGIECRKDADVVDESPAAYKDVNAVMAAQTDLVEIVHRLRQVLNCKG